MTNELEEAALEAQKRAHVPYSNYRVGAAVLTADGNIYSACNVEAKPSANTLHAEQRAIAKAVEAGEKEILKIVLRAGENGTLPPCGNCRQTLATFNPSMEVIVIDGNGGRQAYDLSELLPEAYTGRSMEDAPTEG